MNSMWLPAEGWLMTKTVTSLTDIHYSGMTKHHHYSFHFLFICFSHRCARVYVHASAHFHFHLFTFETIFTVATWFLNRFWIRFAIWQHLRHSPILPVRCDDLKRKNNQPKESQVKWWYFILKISQRIVQYEFLM